MQLRMFWDQRLLKDHAFLRIEPCGQIIRGNFNDVLRHAGSVRVVARQRVPVRDEVEAFVGGIVLQARPILQRAKVVPNVQTARRAHAAEDAGTLERGSLAPAFTTLLSLVLYPQIGSPAFRTRAGLKPGLYKTLRPKGLSYTKTWDAVKRRPYTRRGKPAATPVSQTAQA